MLQANRPVHRNQRNSWWCPRQIERQAQTVGIQGVVARNLTRRKPFQPRWLHPVFHLPGAPPTLDTAGEFPPAADQPEAGQDGCLGERKLPSPDGPDEFASSVKSA